MEKSISTVRQLGFAGAKAVRNVATIVALLTSAREDRVVHI